MNMREEASILWDMLRLAMKRIGDLEKQVVFWRGKREQELLESVVKGGRRDAPTSE